MSGDRVPRDLHRPGQHKVLRTASGPASGTAPIPACLAGLLLDPEQERVGREAEDQAP